MAIDLERQCRACTATKPIEEFYRHRSRGRDYRDHTCKPCRQRQQNAWIPTAHARARKVTVRRAVHLRQLYGLTVQAFQALYAAQDGRCANQGCRMAFSSEVRKADSVYVDHDHKTGHVRGLLCMGCNMALGRLRDDLERITGLASYLQATR